MFYEGPENPPARSPTGPKIVPRRTGPTGPKVRQGSSPGNASRISRMEGTLMIVIAGALDGFQFLFTLIPVIGWVLSWPISFFAWCVFGFWFASKGINLFSGTRAFGTLGAMLAEAIPIINGLPLWTARITIAVLDEWRK